MDKLSIDSSSFSREKIITENEQLEEDIDNLIKLIAKHRTKIRDNEKKLYIECDHSWSTESGVYSRSTDVCKYCKLYRNEFMYR